MNEKFKNVNFCYKSKVKTSKYNKNVKKKYWTT